MLGNLAGARARPHGLRHTGITAALEATNGDLRAVAKFSRHKDVRVVGLYDDDRRDLAGAVATKVAAVLDAVIEGHGERKAAAKAAE